MHVNGSVADNSEHVAPFGAPVGAFRHEALFYTGMEEFVASTGDFIRAGIEAEQPVLVVVQAHKIPLLEAELGPEADRVLFADMADVGSNPSRIIPAWHEFVDRCSDVQNGFRGIGEPVYPERSSAELAECRRHESLLNLAFAGGPPWWLLCPYDTDVLSPQVLDEARRTHPYAQAAGGVTVEADYEGLDRAAAPFDDPLPEPRGETSRLAFGSDDLAAVRRFVAHCGAGAGLSHERTDALVVAVNEVATNSLRYGGGTGILRVWGEDATLVCEVSDRGHIQDPLAGRFLPADNRYGGRGLWMVNQLCDLVQMRNFRTGNVIRIHMHGAR
ncbi:MAG TPA: sensor histidine kinase [Actinomycetota bacterium]|nr:sensor histidine kinase [Actinomycetota bacterium]